MIFNLHFAKDIILCFFFFLFIDLYILIPAVVTQIFTLVAELVIPNGISTEEAEAEIETHPAIVEIALRE